MDIVILICIALFSYLVGSLSTGILVSGKKNIDIRKVGSNNPGASNVLRVMGTKWGIITFLGDTLKTVISCLFSLLLLPNGAFGLQAIGLIVAGVFTVIGHNWPIYYGFVGGKGVACSVSALFFVNPILGLLSVLICLLVIALSRFISLGSMSMMCCFFILSILNTVFGFCPFYGWDVILFAAMLFSLCVFRHGANIGRLLNGTERKIGVMES